MKYSFIKNSIKIDGIIEQLNNIKKKYEGAKLIDNKSNNLIPSYAYISSIELIIKESITNTISSSLIETGLRILLSEKEDFNNFFYFIKLILDTKSENEYYKAISLLYSSENNINSANEKNLLESMFYIADRYLFCDLDIVNFNKWFKLIGECKVDTKNENYRAKNTTISEQGLFKYSVNKNPEKNAIHFMISMLDNVSNKNNQISIELVDSVLEYFFSIKNDLSDLIIAREVFLQILTIVNKTIVSVAKQIKKQSLTDVEKNRIIELLFISYDNDFASYVPSLRKIIDNVYDLTMSIIESIEQIDIIKNTLLVEEIENNNLAYYTTANSFSFMLPYRNKGDKEDKEDKEDKTGMLPLMNISYMNDPTEGSVLFKYLHINKNNKERKIAPYPYIYIKSFTSLVDYLPMWEMYADKGKGICVVLDWSKIRNQECELFRICYLNVRGTSKRKIEDTKNRGLDVKTLRECLRKLQTIHETLKGDIKEKFENSLQKIAYLFKDSHYYSEEETRIIMADNVFDENTSTTKGEGEIDINNCPYLYKYASFIPYIKEIIIGPKFKDADFNFPFIKFEIEKMCKLLNYNMPKITFSDIDYR